MITMMSRMSKQKLTTSRNLTLLALCLAVLWATCAVPASEARIYDGCAILSEGNEYQLWWSVVDTTVFFKIRAKVSGWMGFGISATAEMGGSGSGSDLWVAYIDNGACNNGCINDYYTETPVRPRLDTALGGTSNIVLHSGEESDGYMTFEFSRALQTGDTYDRDINPDLDEYFLFAFNSATKPNSPSDFEIHDFSQDGPGARQLKLSSISCSAVYTNCQILQSAPLTKYYWSINQTVLYSKLEYPLTTGWVAAGISTGADAEDDAIFAVGYFDDDACSSGCLVPANRESGVTTIVAPGDTTYGFTVLNVDSTNGVATFEWSRVLGDDISAANQTAYTTFYIFAGSNSTSSDAPLDTFEEDNFTNSNRSAVILADSYNCTTNTPATNGSSNPLSNSYTNPAGTWNIGWNIQDDEIHFVLKAHTTAWVGFGISTSDGMADSDIIWGQINNDATPVISDRWASSTSKPGRDDEQNVEIIADESNVIDGITTLSFKRLLNTGDSKDTPITNSGMYLLWAIGGSKGTANGDDFDFQKHATRGIATLNFFTGSSSEVSSKQSLRKAHGILMMTAWGLTVLIATFVARYLKSTFCQWFLFGYSWLHIHAILQVLTMLLTLVAFIIICVWVREEDIEHFKGAHEVIGLVIFICSVLQPILGVVTERLIRKDKKQHWVQMIIAEVHCWFGRAIMVLAIINVYFGFYLLCVHPLAIGAFSAMLFVYLIMFGSHEILRWFRWGAWLGGPGFTYDQLSKGGNKDDPKSDVNKWTEFTEHRRAQKAPLPYKITIWSFDSIGVVLLVALWALVVAGISISDVDDPDSFFSSSCTVGEFPPSDV